MTAKPLPKILDKPALHAAAALLARRDPALRAVHRRLGPPSLWKRSADYSGLVKIILEQQVSLASANAVAERLRLACRPKVTAGRVTALKTDGLRALGFSRQKARYALALADDVTARRLVIGRLRHLDDEGVRQQITARLGLGDWSADVFLMLALQRPDLFPIGDLALVKGLHELDGGTYPDADALLARGESWRPYRSVATRMVWQLYLANRSGP